MPLRRTPPSSPAPVLTAPLPAGATVEPATLLERSSSTPSPAATDSIVGSLKLKPALQQIHSCSSEPNLTESLNASLRKRKRSLCDSENLDDFMKEMRQMFKVFREEQDKRSDRLCSAVEDIRLTVDFLAVKYEVLQERVDKLEVNRQADRQYIMALEERLDNHDRSLRSTCLEIRNIPATTSETKASLLDTFINTSKVLKVPVERNDVKDIFRIITKNPAQKTIIVDLASVLLKEKVVSMFRQFNKGTTRLNTEHLRISGTPIPIFISENLSAKMKKLFYQAREFAKENDFKFCWVTHGKIFLRKRENGPLVRIANETDFVKVNDRK
ncbi:Zinc finger DNA binding protein [Operophtera brumata]|uniref:Zinc finger DNA binding protein n=1 Tax=Operophtera brumata TaxID=104452 RepID=A0A0L7K351_OPEBR|nr:Zinc finger DNA binding protein [Operophtera brumata]